MWQHGSFDLLNVLILFEASFCLFLWLSDLKEKSREFICSKKPNAPRNPIKPTPRIVPGGKRVGDGHPEREPQWEGVKSDRQITCVSPPLSRVCRLSRSVKVGLDQHLLEIRTFLTFNQRNLFTSWYNRYQGLFLPFFPLSSFV